MNGLRDQQLHFRVSKQELERIWSKMESSGILSIGSYLRKMALDGYCLRLDLPELRRIMFSTYILQGSFMIAVTLFQSLGKAKKATWLVLFRQIILFIPLCVVLPMIGGMGIRGVWLAIALTDAILVAIIAFMVAYEFRKLPATSSVNR